MAAEQALAGGPGADLDDPYQCAYCGRPTDAADRRCPHCGRSLLVIARASFAPGPALRSAVFLICVLAAVSVLEAAPPLFAWQAARGDDAAPYRLLLQTPGAALLLGDFLAWPGAAAQTLLIIAAARAALLALGAAGLALRAAPAYYLALGALVLDALWNLYRLAGGYIGPAGMVVNVGLGLGALALLFAADRDFAVVRRRLLVQPDPGLRGGLSYHRRGHEYRRRGMWALAVAHWRLAIGAQPQEVHYYKDLAAGYAQIGRYERSLQALAEAARQAPEDGEVEEMARLVREKAAKA